MIVIDVLQLITLTSSSPLTTYPHRQELHLVICIILCISI
jgi:hypothetical protein